MLGQGSWWDVFHDNEKIYKVLIFRQYDRENLQKMLLYRIPYVSHALRGSPFFSQLVDYFCSEEACVLIYPFEEWTPCTYFLEEEVIEFLVEVWRRKIIFRSIGFNNFIRVQGRIKYIDCDPLSAIPYNDNDFQNLVTRFFIYLKYQNEKDESYIHKLRRSAINNFHLIELEGLQHFMNKVFSRIIYLESTNKNIPHNKAGLLVSEPTIIESEGTYTFAYSDDLNMESLFWFFLRKGLYLEVIDTDQSRLDERLYFRPSLVTVRLRALKKPNPPVSLVIKACVQDAPFLYQCVSHIVRQLSSPYYFDDIILALDLKQKNFLREYNSDSTWNDLIRESNRLLQDRVIDRVVYPKTEDIERTNLKWWGLSTSTTHTEEGVPVTSQLYAFDQAKNEYILQLDCDVMIGRLDMNHDYLDDMIKEIERNENVLSVGFNIYKGKTHIFTPYYGYEAGGFVPEVRCCLLNRRRLEALLPIPNSASSSGFKLSWYRALEKYQREAGKCSIRGGDSRSFYIHPQNYRKKDPDVWLTILDRVENLAIPESQVNEWDLRGSYYDWCQPKRNEPMVIVSCFRNIPFARFLRYWLSLTSQTFSDWGLILIDDASDNGIHHYIKYLINDLKYKITFIRNRVRVGLMKNIYKSIHYFMQNPESIVCIIDPDDALIGRNVLMELYEHYMRYNYDVIIGRMYKTDELYAHYPYTPNFVNPRLTNGNVWQHLKSFKKYLFDSIKITDIKIKRSDRLSSISLRPHKDMIFPEYSSSYAYMIPIVEMSRAPFMMDHYTLFHEPTTSITPEIRAMRDYEITQIFSKPPRHPSEVEKGRKTFIPNLNRIEIDITYHCNLKCLNCNRSSTQAPAREEMSLNQIHQFIKESIELGKKWEIINILGGEPTLHENFLEIVQLILTEYIDKFSPNTILQITTNGYGEEVQTQLRQLPAHPALIIDYDSFKEDRIVEYFSPFNDAPIDKPDADKKEFYKGCWVTAYCGIGLNAYGYYPCGVAGGIDRVMQFRKGIPSLKEAEQKLRELLSLFCQYCGNFDAYDINRGDFIPRAEKDSLSRPIISKTWQKAYAEYNRKKRKQ